LKRRSSVTILVLTGCVLACVLAEVGMRIYLSMPLPANRGSWIPDAAAGYRLRPQGPGEVDRSGADYHVNSLGFRDREHPLPKPPGRRRILGIGDSFVFGEGRLSESFLRVAEAALVSRGDSADIVLMGLGGYGPDNYVGVLQGHGLGLTPDGVLLCFYVGNDVTGQQTRHAVRRGELYPATSARPWLNLARRSYLFGYLERGLFFRLRASRLVRDGAGDGAGRPSFTRKLASFYYRQVQENRLAVYLRSPTPELESLWRSAESSLLTFDRICREAQIPWGMVLIPDEIQVDPAIRRTILESRTDRGRYHIDEPQRRLGDFSARYDVPVLDLLPILREAHQPDSSLYLPDDTHWSPRGNRVAGQAVAAFVQKLFPSKPARSRRPHGTHAGGARPQTSE